MAGILNARLRDADPRRNSLGYSDTARELPCSLEARMLRHSQLLGDPEPFSLGEAPRPPTYDHQRIRDFDTGNLLHRAPGGWRLRHSASGTPGGTAKLRATATAISAKSPSCELRRGVRALRDFGPKRECQSAKLRAFWCCASIGPPNSLTRIGQDHVVQTSRRWSQNARSSSRTVNKKLITTMWSSSPSPSQIHNHRFVTEIEVSRDNTRAGLLAWRVGEKRHGREPPCVADNATAASS